jgi:hypothetical protein
MKRPRSLVCDPNAQWNKPVRARPNFQGRRFWMLGEIVGIVGKVASQVAGKFFPNPEDELKREALEHQFQLAVLERSKEIELAAADVVKTEAAGQGWLQRSWRPVTMLTFTGLIVARWLGWSAPNLSEAEALKLWDIVQLGLGGYVIGRSAEKILPRLGASFAGGKP